MAKPPPTRTRSKAPVSLSPVKALSKPPERQSADASTRSGPAGAPAAAAAKAAPRRASAKAADAPAAVAKAAPAESSASSAPAATKPMADKSVPAMTNAAKPAPAKPAQAKPAPSKPAAAKAAVSEAPAAKPVATSMPTAAAKPAVRTTGGAAPMVAAAAAAQTATESAAATVEAVGETVAKVAHDAVAASVAKAKKAAPQPVSLGQLPPPRLPQAATLAGEAVLSQTLAVAKTWGAMQARMLQHACEEFKASVDDAEKLARVDTPSQAVTLQAQAIRRTYESYADHLRELARIANAGLKKD